MTDPGARLERSRRATPPPDMPLSHRRARRWDRSTRLLSTAVLAALFAVGPVGGGATAAAPDSDGDRLTDAFETTWSRTDPRDPDTDDDGVRDGAEDLDEDGLSNLWEQRLDLDPLGDDSDGDGVRDAREDADRDGLRNGFEVRHRVSDPRRRDSDRDGLRDSAEDPDGDRLSNRGEQRFGTSPATADSDGDGTPDGNDDADGDGGRDAFEQDDRPVPGHLVPSLGEAPSDFPSSYRDGCHSGIYTSSIRPCVYGDPRGSTSIALFGDSHAQQWVPALQRLASQRGWKLIVLTKSACPSVDVRYANTIYEGAEASCATWRGRGGAWLRDHTPDVILISNSRGYRIVDALGRQLPRPEAEVAWQRGLRRTIDRMPRASAVVVLADTPHMDHVVPQCLAANPGRLSACSTPRGAAIHPRHDDGERRVARANGADYVSLTDQVCPYDPCPAIVDEQVIWRNQSHLTATYARRLAPSMAAVLDSVAPVLRRRTGSG